MDTYVRNRINKTRDRTSVINLPKSESIIHAVLSNMHGITCLLPLPWVLLYFSPPEIFILIFSPHFLSFT